MADAFASPGHHFKQQAQLWRDVVLGALLFDQVSG
jgi:hypothetical protein